MQLCCYRLSGMLIKLKYCFLYQMQWRLSIRWGRRMLPMSWRLLLVLHEWREHRMFFLWGGLPALSDNLLWGWQIPKWIRLLWSLYCFHPLLSLLWIHRFGGSLYWLFLHHWQLPNMPGFLHLYFLLGWPCPHCPFHLYSLHWGLDFKCG